MPNLDSLQKVLHDTTTLEYVNVKLNELKEIISKPDPAITIWLPLLSSIVGGLLVWIGQSIERNTSRKSEKEKSRLSIYSYCRKLEAIMRNNYRELAMAKTHAEYWWYCHNTSSMQMAQKYYEEHLKSQSFAREIERRIGETKADYIGHVRKFQAIKELPKDIEQKLNAIADLTHPKAKAYSFEENHEKVRFEKAESDEAELREKYYKNLIYFKTINDNLQTLV